jgi:hypothetical protein
MTKQSIFAYLEAEDAAKSADARITRIIYKNGSVSVVHFIRESQDQN